MLKRDILEYFLFMDKKCKKILQMCLNVLTYFLNADKIINW